MTKMNKRKVAQIVSLLCIVIAVALCILLFQSPLFNPSRLFYDDRLLVGEVDNVHAVNSVMTNSDGEFSFGSFSGSRTVQIIDDNAGSLVLTWDVVVTKGRFKIVLIDTENAKVVQVICEGTSRGSVEVNNLPAGEYRIKFVGDNATVKGTFSLQ